MQTFHFEILIGNKFVDIFLIYYWTIPSIPSFYKEKAFQTGATFWIAPFSNISKTSYYTNENCSFDIFWSLFFSPEVGKLQMGFSTPLH